MCGSRRFFVENSYLCIVVRLPEFGPLKMAVCPRGPMWVKGVIFVDYLKVGLFEPPQLS